MLATPDTGLPTPLATSGTLAGVGDVFFFGNAVGDDLSGETTIAFTNSTDDLDARNHPGVATITNIYDYNKDGFVNASDSLIARGNPGSIRFINIGNPPSVRMPTKRQPQCFAIGDHRRYANDKQRRQRNRLGTDLRRRRRTSRADRFRAGSPAA